MTFSSFNAIIHRIGWCTCIKIRRDSEFRWMEIKHTIHIISLASRFVHLYHCKMLEIFYIIQNSLKTSHFRMRSFSLIKCIAIVMYGMFNNEYGSWDTESSRCTQWFMVLHFNAMGVCVSCLCVCAWMGKYSCFSFSAFKNVILCSNEHSFFTCIWLRLSVPYSYFTYDILFSPVMVTMMRW